jgi:hypothetical protein
MTRRTIIPAMQITVEVPVIFEDMRAPDRVINAAGKRALEEELVKHHETRIPRHFLTEARSRYRHQERKEPYKRIKLRVFRSRTDLVRKGTTKQFITSMRSIRIGGTVTGSKRHGPGLTGSLTMRLPFPAARDNKTPGGVTVEKMRREITETTADEEADLAAGYGERLSRYMEEYFQRRTTSKQRLLRG